MKLDLGEKVELCVSSPMSLHSSFSSDLYDRLHDGLNNSIWSSTNAGLWVRLAASAKAYREGPP